MTIPGAVSIKYISVLNHEKKYRLIGSQPAFKILDKSETQIINKYQEWISPDEF
jgi:hypothetical protein